MHTTRRKPHLVIAALGVEFAAGAEAPRDIRLIPAGEFRSWDGRPTECAAWVCTDDDGLRLVAEAAARASPQVIDYEHATLHAKKAGTPAPAGGWFKALEWRVGDGLWAIGVDWTAAAAQAIVSKEYRFISPVFSYDAKTGRVGKLFHAALTNDPGLDGLTDLAALAAELFLPTHPLETEMDFLKKLLASLGLAESATEAEALAAVASMKTNVVTLSAQVSAPDPARFVPVATLSALQTEHAQLQGKLVALQGEVDGGKLEKIVADGLAIGKLTPATESWARELGKSNLASLSAYLATAPVVIQPGKTQTGDQGGGDQGGSLTDNELAICTTQGLNPADYLKTKLATA